MMHPTELNTPVHHHAGQPISFRRLSLKLHITPVPDRGGRNMYRPRHARRVPLCETAFLTPQGLAPARGCTGIRGQGVAIWNLEKLFPGKAAGIAPAAFFAGRPNAWRGPKA
jgi:hypothetical protein